MAYCVRHGRGLVSFFRGGVGGVLTLISCPRYEQCRCDVYGWCGPLKSGETLQAVTVKGKTENGKVHAR